MGNQGEHKPRSTAAHRVTAAVERPGWERISACGMAGETLTLATHLESHMYVLILKSTRACFETASKKTSWGMHGRL